MSQSSEPNGPGPSTGPYSPTTERLASAAHQTVDRAAQSASRAEQEIREGTARAADKAHRYERQARQAADQWVGEAENFVHRHPMASAGIAFAAGMILSGMLRR